MFFQWGTAVDAYHDQKDAIADRKDRRLKSRVTNMQAFNELVASNPDADPNFLVQQYNQMELGGDPVKHVNNILAYHKAERAHELKKREYENRERDHKIQAMIDSDINEALPQAKSYHDLQQMIMGRHGDHPFVRNALSPYQQDFTGTRKKGMTNWMITNNDKLKTMDASQRANHIRNTWGDDGQDLINTLEQQRTKEFYATLIPDLKQFTGVDDDKLEGMLKGRASLAGFNPEFVQAKEFRAVMEPFQHQVITGLQKEYDTKVEGYTTKALSLVEKEIQDQAKNLKPVIGEIDAPDNLKNAALVIANTYKLRNPQSITDVLRYMDSRKDRYKTMYSQDIAADVINNIQQGNVKGMSKHMIQSSAEAAQEKARAQVQGYRPTDSFAKNTAPVAEQQIQNVSLDNFYGYAQQKLKRLPPEQQSAQLEVMKAVFARNIDSEIDRLNALKADGFSNGLRSDEDKNALQNLIDKLEQMKVDLKPVALDDTKFDLMTEADETEVRPPLSINEQASEIRKKAVDKAVSKPRGISRISEGLYNSISEGWDSYQRGFVIKHKYGDISPELAQKISDYYDQHQEWPTLEQVQQ